MPQQELLDVDWLPPELSAAEVAAVPVEEQWTAEMVCWRLIDAAKTAEAVVSRPGPGRRSTAWPQIVRDWADLMEHKAEDAGRPRRFISRAQVQRMEEAMLWPTRYVRDPRQRIVLAEYLRARAQRKSFSDAIKRRRWSRATAYRTRDRALAIIAVSLMRDGVRP